jgi:hypothetical protein
MKEAEHLMEILSRETELLKEDPSQGYSNHKSHCGLGLNPGRRGEKPATNSLSHVLAL